MTATSIQPGKASSDQCTAVAHTITSTEAMDGFKHPDVGPELNVEAKLHHVTVVHHVVLALHAHLAGGLGVVH